MNGRGAQRRESGPREGGKTERCAGGGGGGLGGGEKKRKGGRCSYNLFRATLSALHRRLLFVRLECEAGAYAAWFTVVLETLHSLHSAVGTASAEDLRPPETTAATEHPHEKC